MKRFNYMEGFPRWDSLCFGSVQSAQGESSSYRVFPADASQPCGIACLARLILSA